MVIQVEMISNCTGTAKNGMDDSARGTVDLEKAAAQSGSSARGSAQFLVDVESQRSIKVFLWLLQKCALRYPQLDVCESEWWLWNTVANQTF